MAVLLWCLQALTAAAQESPPPGSWELLLSPTRNLHAAVYDSRRQRLLILGGIASPAGTFTTSRLWAMDLGPSARWTAVPTAGAQLSTLPSSLTGIYDPSHDRVLLVGSGVWTLSLSGTPTLQQVIASGPTPPFFTGRCAVYDAIEDRVVTFGGYDHQEVWALRLSGSPTWTQLSPTGTPPAATIEASAVFDPETRRMLVFGGSDPQGNTSDLLYALELAPSPRWVLLSGAAAGPGKRRSAAMTYDPRRRRLLLMGGFGWGGAGMLGDTWSFDLRPGGNWTMVQAGGNGPPARCHHAIAFDTARDRMILHGGSKKDYNGSGVDYQGDAWALDFSTPNPTWSELVPLPPDRLYHLAAFDSRRRRLIVYGGYQDVLGPLGDAWGLSLTGTPTWQPLTSSGPIIGQAGFYDSRRDRLLVFGGGGSFLSSSSTNAVIALSMGASPAWSTVASSGVPPAPRMWSSVAYDSQRDRLIVFGGVGAAYYNDVWALTLSGPPTWTAIVAAGPAPVPRQQAAIIYDPVRDRLVVHGGYTPQLPNLVDTWALSLSGTPAWTKLGESPGAPAVDYGFGNLPGFYDARRDRMIVATAGGVDRTQMYEAPLTGALTWSPMSISSGEYPTGRRGRAIALDTAGDAFYLTAGADYSLRNDTWRLSLGEGERPSLSGAVRAAESGLPIPRARVTDSSPSGVQRTLVADEFGAFAFYGLEVGLHEVVASAPGFVAVETPVTVEGSTSASVVLRPTLDADRIWVSRPSMLVARSAPQVARVASLVHVVGGGGSGGPVAAHQAFDPLANAWINYPNAPRVRVGGAAAELGGRLYLAGGIGAVSAVTVTDRFDPGVRTWAPAGAVAAIPHPGWGVGGAVVGGGWYVAGGYADGEGHMPWLRRYDAATNAWTLVSSMPTARSWLACAEFDGKLFAIGGWNAASTTALRTVEVFDPSTGTWANGPAMPLALKDLSAASDPVHGKLYVVGGTTGDGAFGDEVVHTVGLELQRDGAGYRWSFVGAHPVTGAAVSVEFSNDELHAFGGRTGYQSGYLASAWAFVPRPRPDLVVRRVEVAQAVASSRLVQGRPTVVRAYVQNLGAAIPRATAIRGLLHVGVPDGSELFTREARDPLVWPTTDVFDAAAEQAGMSTLNFYLDAGEVNRSSLRFWVEIDQNQALTEADEGNNSTSDTPLDQTFVAARSLRVGYSTISSGTAPTYRADMGTAAALWSKVYPVTESEWTYVSHFDWTGKLDWEAHARLRLLRELALQNAERRLARKPLLDRLVGFFDEWPAAFSSTPGKTVMNEAVSLLDGRAANKQQLVAHELGHTLGLRGEYYSCSGGTCNAADWDPKEEWWVSECPVGRYPCGNQPTRVRTEGLAAGRFAPTTAFDVLAGRPAAWAPPGTTGWSDRASVRNVVFLTDPKNSQRVSSWRGELDPQLQSGNRRIGFMGSLALGDAFAWTTADVWERLIDRLSPSGGPATPTGGRGSDTGPSAQLWAYFMMSADGGVQALPWWTMSTDLPEEVPEGADHTFELVGEIGEILAAHAFGVGPLPGDTAAFALRVPLPAGARRARILRGPTVLFERAISFSPPTVQLGELPAVLAGDSVALVWSITDPEDDQFVADLFYSPDSGATWMTIACEVQGTRFSWPLAAVPGTSRGMVRISVSDGVRTGEDTTATGFTIPDRPAVVVITSPEDSVRIVEGEPVRLEARVFDLETGEMAAPVLRWTSSELPADLGITRTLELDSLPAGQHHLRVSLADVPSAESGDSLILFVDVDADRDRMPDWWEAAYPILDPGFADAGADPDADRLSNLAEYRLGTSPASADTDGDGLLDDAEVAFGSDPTLPTPVTGVPNERATSSVRLACAPNPFHGDVRIHLGMPYAGAVLLEVFDIAGRRIATIHRGKVEAGVHSYQWNGRGPGGTAGSGVYFVRAVTPGVTRVTTIVRVR